MLEISQSLVPLGAELKRFNNARPSDISSVNVFELRISGSAVPRAELGDVSEEFAPQAFRDLSDKDKLAAASYEPMKGGVAAAGGKALATDYVIGRPVTYENIVDDGTPNVPPTRKKVAGTAPLFTALVRGGAVGASPLSRRVAVRRQRNSVRNVSAKEERSASSRPPISPPSTPRAEGSAAARRRTGSQSSSPRDGRRPTST